MILNHPSGVRVQKHAVIWVARPRGGKDTQTDAFRDNLGFPVFHSGDTLADYAKKNRQSHILAERHNGNLANCDVAVWLAKIWVLKNLGQPLIHLNGSPRSPEQLVVLIPFLVQRGFIPRVIWFTTPKEVCQERPGRVGRELEDTPEVFGRRIQTYDQKTAPMLPIMQQKFGMSMQNGSLLLIDNTHLTKEQTGQRILEFLGLSGSVSVRNLFPPANQHSIPAHGRRPQFSISAMATA